MKGAQKDPELVKLNPMGKLPLVVDGDAVITEVAAIGIYLADRYSLGKLAPKLDDSSRRRSSSRVRWRN
jgi:glutathione S-transferase